jgi:hypothetical protein
MNRQSEISARATHYQSDFAKRLVKAIGYDEAVQACYENQWLGTLIHVQDLKGQMKA